MYSAAIIIVIVVFAFLLFFAAAKRASNAGRLKKKRLLTTNEAEFLERMEGAAPEFRFHAQVSMGALMEPASRDRREVFRLRGQFSQKIVDFVAQSRVTGDIVALIELDDRTHSADKDQKRDAMTASAGYKTVRWTSKAKPLPAEIRRTLLALV